MAKTLNELMNTLPQQGTVTWLGVRPARLETMVSLDDVQATAGDGLLGDRFSARSNIREVTLIQGEHLTAIASMLGLAVVDPALLRRNVVVNGINLLALKAKRFIVGEVVMEFTGLAQPCSKMEVALGAGGYNAMRGHGGITAKIITSGKVRLGDVVAAETAFREHTLI